MVQHGRRAVYEPGALAFEKPTPTNETEYRRKVRMFEHCWAITCEGSMLRRLPPDYLVAILSHRVLRYGERCAASRAARYEHRAARRGLALSGGARRAGRARRRGGRRPAGCARYYTLVSWATVQALANYLRRGVPAAGTRRGRGEPGARRRARRRRAGAVRSVARGSRALAIKLEGGGPVLYRQTRVGGDGVDFELSSSARWSSAPRRSAPASPSTRATPGSPASGASSGGRRSTSCRSSGTSFAATCR